MVGQRRIRVFVAILGIFATLLVGCTSPKSSAPARTFKIALVGEAAPMLNRDINGEPNSVVLRVYYLKDKAEFCRLAFDMATGDRSDAELLGQDFLGKTENVLVPGSTFAGVAELPAGTAYLGLVALFRKPDPNYWRYLVASASLTRSGAERIAVRGEKLPFVSFRVEECFLALRNPRPEFIPGQPEEGLKPTCLGTPVPAPIRGQAPPKLQPSSPKAPKPGP